MSPHTHLRRAFGLTPTEAEIVLDMWKRTSPVHALDFYPTSDDPEQDVSRFRVHLCGLRKKLPRGAVANQYGRGYVLTREGEKAVSNAL